MNPELEKFIGKPISELLKLGEIEFKGENFYSLKLKSDNEFCDVSYSNLTVSVNEIEIVTMLYIVFPMILDRSFYDEMLKKYEYPNNILAIDKLEQESKSEAKDEDFNQILAKRSYSTKEVAFEDKPVWIIWEKEFYEISMGFYYKENGPQLIFRKPSDDYLNLKTE